MKSQAIQRFQLLNSQKSMSNSMTVAGLLNGMIGGTILVLPIIGMSTGYVTTILICSLIGFLSYYTAHLIVVHLGKANNMTQCILDHFSQNYSYMIGYSLIVWSGQIPTLIIYFNLICLQLQGLIGDKNYIGIIVALALMIQVFVIAHFDIGEQTMGIGIVSIISYLIFIGWGLFTAPKGDHEILAFGDPYLLISTLLMAYFIHDILTQNIIKNPNKHDYKSIVAVTFLLATLAYAFITQGAFGIINRSSYKKNPQTIEDYFQMGGIEVTIIQLLYLVHLFTVFPQYLRFSKIRFFNVLRIQNAKTLQWKKVIYYFIVIAVCFSIHLLDIRIDLLIAINGGVIGNLIVIVIPVCIHIKCVYFDKKCGEIACQDLLEKTQVTYECHYIYTNKITKYLQLVFLVFIVIFGFYTMIQSMKSQLNPKK